MDREKLIQLRWLLKQWRDKEEKEGSERHLYLSIEIGYIDEDIKDKEEGNN